MGTIRMSNGERRRLETMSRVSRGELTLVKAAELVGVSYRQMKRVWQRYQQQGDAGLVHGLRGRSSNRKHDDSLRERVLDICRSKYSDFGPTLASEYLQSEEGISIASETLRRWMVESGIWLIRSRRCKHRHRRARKEQLGEMVQMDGSWHDWFEGRGPWASLMVMIDDATNRTYARFFKQETTAAAMETFLRYIRRNGLPQSLYVDRDSIYRPSREETAEELLSGMEVVTQFGRAMKGLEVRLILANSPQAKGRVERRNQLFQDRLVKALRLANISDIDAANQFLERRFLGDLNRRFTVKAVRNGDLHRKAPALVALKRILAIRESRRVQNDWTVLWCGRCLQLTSSNRSSALAGQMVDVVEQLDGRLLLLYRGRELKYEDLPARPPKSPTRRAKRPTVKPRYRPPASHPWRRDPVGRGDRH